MQDPALDRTVSDCRNLLGLWSKFQEYFEAAVKGDNVTPDNEKRFLELKSRIAMLHDVFMANIDEGRGNAAVGQGMLDNVIRSITLKHVNRLSSADVKKMQIEWHESYLLLNETIGDLEEKQAKLAKITASQAQMMSLRKNVSQTAGNILLSMYFRIAVAVVVVVAAIAGLYLTGMMGKLRDLDATAKAAFWIQDNIARPYLNKEIPWRNLKEAMDYGRDMTKKAENFKGWGGPDPLRSGADPALKWFCGGFKGAIPITSMSGLALAKSKEFSSESFRVEDPAGKFDLYCLYFRFETVAEALKAVEEYNGWAAKLPPGVKFDVDTKVKISNDYNVVALFICEPKNDYVIKGMRDDVWKMDKVKR